MKRLTYSDLQSYQGLIVSRFGDLAARPQVMGEPQVGLTPADVRALAYLDAAMTILGRLGMLRTDEELVLTHDATKKSEWTE